MAARFEHPPCEVLVTVLPAGARTFSNTHALVIARESRARRAASAPPLTRATGLIMTERDGLDRHDGLRRELARIAAALERLVALLEPRAPRRVVRKEKVEVCETDRAAARAIARRMGLHVRGSK